MMVNRLVERMIPILKYQLFHSAGCKSVFRSVYKLADHVRSHTQEKLVGCPTCGGLFATKTKFFDHCKRQVPLESKLPTCWRGKKKTHTHTPIQICHRKWDL